MRLPLPGLCVFFLIVGIGGCGPRPLSMDPPEASLPDTSKCYGLATNFHYAADRFSADDYSTKALGARKHEHFLNMFGFVSHPDLKEKPAYGRAVFDPARKSLELALHAEDRRLLARTTIPKAAILDCGPEQTTLSLDYSYCTESRCSSLRRTVKISRMDPFARIHTHTEAESPLPLFLSSSRTQEYWGDFRPYGDR